MLRRVAGVLVGFVMGAGVFMVAPAVADKGDQPPPQTDTFDFKALYEACDADLYRLEVRADKKSLQVENKVARIERKNDRIDRLQARVERLRHRLHNR